MPQTKYLLYEISLSLSLSLLLLIIAISISTGYSQADQIVVLGQFETSQGHPSSDGTTIYTVHDFVIDKVLQGRTSESDLQVVTLGGQTEDGLLVVSHQPSVYPHRQYLLSLVECTDCINETSYQIEAMHHERMPGFGAAVVAASNQATIFAEKDDDACPQVLDRNGDGQHILKLKAGSINLTSVEGMTANGYIYYYAQTRDFPKPLYSFEADLSYSEAVFGTNPLANETLQVSFPDGVSETTYTTSLSLNEDGNVSFTTEKNSSEASGALLVDTLYKPFLRLDFSFELSGLYDVEGQLSDLVAVESSTASFICADEIVPFDTITVEDTDISIKQCLDGNTNNITYSFGNFSYASNGIYTFTVFATSDQSRELRQATAVIDYSTSTFFPSAVGSGQWSIHPDPATVVTQYPGAYPSRIVDVDNNTMELVVGNAFVQPSPQQPFVFMPAGVPIALATFEVATNNCNTNPQLGFEEIRMQGLSYYYDEGLPPFFSVEYCAVEAEPDYTVHPCGCDNVRVTDFTPDEIVAGDNQILTITGTGFGTYERSPDPSEGGTKSSVLFTNGDNTDSGSANDNLIAAADADFRDDDFVLQWTDTEIRVRVPSTDYRELVFGPASSGRFTVRNRCNDTDRSPRRLRIPYALSNNRVDDDGVAKPLSLRKDGTQGAYDGYVFAFNDNVNLFSSKNIRGVFSSSLQEWCNDVGANFRILDEGNSITPTSKDGVNSIAVGSLLTANGQAGMLQSATYFEIDCEGSDLSTFDGGYVFTDIDFVIDVDFLQGSASTQSRLETVFLHELGHAHMLTHARKTTTNPFQNNPTMVSIGAAGLESADIDGGNRLFGVSGYVASFDCEINGSALQIDPISTGMCGAEVSSASSTVKILAPVVYPTQATNFWTVESKVPLQSIHLFSATGAEVKWIDVDSKTIEMIPNSNLSPGAYFLKLRDVDGNLHSAKIIKL